MASSTIQIQVPGAPGTSVHFQGKFCGGTNIVHVLSFLVAKAEISFLSRSSYSNLFNFVVHRSAEGKVECDPHFHLFLCDARTTYAQTFKFGLNINSKKEVDETFWFEAPAQKQDYCEKHVGLVKRPWFIL